MSPTPVHRLAHWTMLPSNRKWADSIPRCRHRCSGMVARCRHIDSIVRDTMASPHLRQSIIDNSGLSIPIMVRPLTWVLLSGEGCDINWFATENQIPQTANESLSQCCRPHSWRPIDVLGKWSSSAQVYRCVQLELRGISWRSEIVPLAIDRYFAFTTRTPQYQFMPAAVVDTSPRRTHLCRTRAQVDVNVNVPIQQFHGKQIRLIKYKWAQSNGCVTTRNNRTLTKRKTYIARLSATWQQNEAVWLICAEFERNHALLSSFPRWQDLLVAKNTENG